MACRSHEIVPGCPGLPRAEAGEFLEEGPPFYLADFIFGISDESLE
jgi:hypothetical protein